MQYLKRILPFFLTFALGLLIASFFVTVTAPNFQFKKRGWRHNHRQCHKQNDFEARQLREENLRLKRQLSEMEKQVDLELPPLPPAPVKPSKERVVILQ